MRTVKGINFTEKDSDILEYLNDRKLVPNASQYVIGLVRADKEKREGDLEATIKRIIDQYIDEGYISVKEKQKNIKPDISAINMLKGIKGGKA